MKVAVVFLAVLAVTSGEVSNKEKRGAIAYTTPKTYQLEAGPQVAYATAKVSPQTFPQQTQPQYQSVKYVTQQQQAPVVYQQPLNYEQGYQGQEQTITKLAPSKGVYAAQPSAPLQSHYSLASDVSSFSYNSPIVKYNNQGVLSQTIGKFAQPEQQVEYSSATQQAAPQVQYSTQKVTYSPQQQQQQKVAYTAAPQQQYSFVAPQQPAKLAYTQLPQKVAYVQAPQQQQIQYSKVAQPQQVAYVSAGQKQQQAYQLIPQSQLQAYLAQAQQSQSQQPQQQQQYVYSQVPQGYEKAYQAAQSNPQPAYVAPQQHYYTVAAKAPATGVRYA